MAALATAGGIREISRWVKWHWDDVVAAIVKTFARIGGEHLVRHVFTCEFGERLGGSDLHLNVDGRCTHIEGTAEDIGKTEYIVDLVGVVWSVLWP